MIYLTAGGQPFCGCEDSPEKTYQEFRDIVKRAKEKGISKYRCFILAKEAADGDKKLLNWFKNQINDIYD